METFLMFFVSNVFLIYICIMDKKKLDIIERSSLIFLKYGIKSVTMDDLANHLGVSKKTIYKYFEDKNDLIITIIKRTLEFEETMCCKIQQHSDNALESLIQISRLVIERLNNVNPAIFNDLQKHHNEAWQILEKHKWDFVLSAISKNIRRGIEEKYYRNDLNVEIISRLYISTIDTIMNSEIYSWPEFQFHELYKEIIRFQFHGLVNENGRNYLKLNFKDEYDV